MRLHFLRRLLVFSIAFTVVGFVSVKHVLAADIYAVKCDLVILGVIATGDDIRFKKELSLLFQTGCAAPSVILYSQGGDLLPASNIGKQIYFLYLTTVAPNLAASKQEPDLRPRNGARICKHMPGSRERYQKAFEYDQRHMAEFLGALRDWRHKKLPKLADFFDYNPVTGEGDPRCTCGSACFIIWAAGAEKRGDVIQIHRPYFDQASFAKMDVRQAEIAYQKLSDDVRSYLLDASVPRELLIGCSGLLRMRRLIFPPTSWMRCTSPLISQS